MFMFFFSSRRRHTRLVSDWSSDVCSSDLLPALRSHPHGQLRHFAPQPERRLLNFRIRFERVIENVERLVKIGAGMFGGYTGAETNLVFRDRRVIYRRDPQTAPSQLVA